MADRPPADRPMADRPMADRPMADRPPKKNKKFSNTPLRISADRDIICGVDGKQGFPPAIQKRGGSWQ